MHGQQNIKIRNGIRRISVKIKSSLSTPITHMGQ